MVSTEELEHFTLEFNDLKNNLINDFIRIEKQMVDVETALEVMKRRNNLI